MRIPIDDTPRWIFGYGSLIWRPDFPFVERRRAALAGWRRRFWQYSPDHRGVPTAPGRVVTLVRELEAVCLGLAFLPPAREWPHIIAALDVREQNGYAVHDVELAFDDGSRAMAIVYVAGPDNPSFAGPAPLAEMAAQIASSHGPSGPNVEYLLRLAEQLEALGIHDDEVHALCEAVIAHRGPAAP